MRISRDWTLQQTADELSISKSAYQMIECLTRNPSQKMLFRIMDIFNYTGDPRELFEPAPEEAALPERVPLKHDAHNHHT
jgi:transcriptional regulator with XRE-family HTH domain